MELEGLAPNTSMKATKTVLTGPSPDAENKDGQKSVILPETSTETIKPEFTSTVPANSLVIFRFIL